MKATFIKRQQQAATIASFSFEPAADYRYTAGQYIELTLDGHHEDGKPAKRLFTLSSAPTEKQLTITTRVGGGANSTYKRALNKLEIGAQVTISEPMGDFVLPMLLQTPLIFVAGGIGITPYRSILSWLHNTGEQRPIKLLIGVKNEDDIIFQETFNSANQHATIIVENPSAAWGGERGHLNAEKILGLEQPSADTLVYLSGPEPFVQAVHKDLRAHGLSSQNIVIDEFQGYEEI